MWGQLSNTSFLISKMLSAMITRIGQHLFRRSWKMSNLDEKTNDWSKMFRKLFSLKTNMCRVQAFVQFRCLTKKSQHRSKNRWWTFSICSRRLLESLDLFFWNSFNLLFVFLIYRRNRFQKSSKNKQKKFYMKNWNRFSRKKKYCHRERLLSMIALE